LKIKVLDINSSMLKVGEDRARRLGYDEGNYKPWRPNIRTGIQFIEGNAEKLDLPDNSIDLYTIGKAQRELHLEL